MTTYTRLSVNQPLSRYSAYAVAPVHTRSDALEFFVWDASTLDGMDRPAVIRQEPTLDAALAGLVV